ncbi:MAG: uracil-DNA glycosylase, partial [Alphaproteobacteria bacterium]|nr:uracil-DNA glycosylase [Alphaproteobacteria bacterium]
AAPVETSAHAAFAATTLAELRAVVESFEGCPLKLTARTTVFGAGAVNARLMVVGEAPGEEEDRQGLPFVGPSGKLLDRMLDSIGLSRERDVHIANVLPWRPPANRTPTPAEVGQCLPFIERHIELIDPAMLLVLGGAAAQALLGKSDSIGRLRGRWLAYSSTRLPRPIPALATYHPAFLLRTPAMKRDVWKDFLMLRKRLEQKN